MYTEIGSFDAKSKLSKLLREVDQGRRYTVTLRGRPVADLVPSKSARRADGRASVEAMRRMPRVTGVSRETLQDWIAEGRR
jgi:prevent-host-death family protein